MENDIKKIYMFNEEVATDYGYFTAVVNIEGVVKGIKYTSIHEDSDLLSVGFEDEKIVGKFKDSELKYITEHSGKYSAIVSKMRKEELKMDNVDLINPELNTLKTKKIELPELMRKEELKMDNVDYTLIKKYILINPELNELENEKNKIKIYIEKTIDELELPKGFEDATNNEVIPKITGSKPPKQK